MGPLKMHQIQEAGFIEYLTGVLRKEIRQEFHKRCAPILEEIIKEQINRAAFRIATWTDPETKTVTLRIEPSGAVEIRKTQQELYG